jgi:quinol-cytochrome oxidoreductase complex cytochrome b subunit
VSMARPPHRGRIRHPEFSLRGYSGIERLAPGLRQRRRCSSFWCRRSPASLLAFNYAPTPGDAYNSLRYILTEVTGGRLIRGLHHWGASMMIVVVVLHMAQVFLYGAYKKPREATWMVGVVLLLLTLAYGLTGYLLPWDNRAYWGTVVATQIAGTRLRSLGPI